MSTPRRSVLLVLVTALLVAGCSAGAQRPPTSAAKSGDPQPAAAAPAAPAKPAGPAAAANPTSDYYAGKTITISVNFSAGGPTDIFARMLVPYLERHIPGRPKLIVENRAGAGGVIGANYVYNVARKDGLTLGIFTSPLGNQVMMSEGVQYDSAQYQWVGAAVEAGVMYASTSTGISGPRDILNARQELIIGGLSPDSSSDLSMRSYLNLLGMRYKYVTGYPGQSDIHLAFRRGEITFAQDSLTTWLAVVTPMVQAGQAVPVGQRGVVRNGQVTSDTRVADIPTLLDVAVDLKGEAVKQSVEYRALQFLSRMTSVTRGMVFPPGTSPELVELVRKGVVDTFADRDFQAASEQQLGIQFEFLPGPESQELARQVIASANDDLQVLDYLKRLSQEKQ